MSRTADPNRRAELLDAAVDYASRNGLATLQLRPLAIALGASPRLLLYYFGSKEELIVAVLARVGERQREAFATLETDPDSFAVTVRAAWKILSAKKTLPIFKLFFEIYGLALGEPERFPGFFARAVGGWLDYLEPSARRDGYSAADARAIATTILAGYRGFLLDLCATGERGRIARAVEFWIAGLDAMRSR